MRLLRKLCSFILALLLLVSITSVPAFAAGDASAKVTGTFRYDYAQAQLDMINDFRTGSEAWYWNSDDTTKTTFAPGELGTLKLDASLEQIAMERARELALYFSHTRPNGDSCFSLTVNGNQSWGENIAAGYGSPSSVFSAWREDNDSYSGQGHRRNMLGSRYTAVGFGCFYHQGTLYWVQEFGYYSGETAPSQSNTEVTGYVEYSTSLLGENYWSDEGNCPSSQYSPPSPSDGDWTYTVDGGAATVTGYNGNDANLIVPSTLGGYPVKAIGDEAFYGEYYIDTITFPDSLESIGAKAFYNSGLVGKVTIPASVKSIGTYAFSYCSYITEFSVDSKNSYYSSYNGALYNKNRTTLLNYPLANSAASYTVPEETTLLYCTSFARARYLQDLYVLGNNVRAMTYTFYSDSFNVWCWHESMLYSQLSNGNLDTSVVLCSFDDIDPEITSHPQNATVNLGSSTTFSVKASGTNLSYQWQYSKNNGSSWTNWSGKTSSSVTVTGSSTNNGCLYRCVVSNSSGSVTSNYAKLTVISKPVITGQPAAATVTDGGKATFTVTATGSSLKYTWQVSKNSGSTWANVNSDKYPSALTKTLSFTVTTSLNGYQYRCIVKNSAGSVTSNAVKLTVKSAKPVITTQPMNVEVTAGNSVSFKVTASGTGLSYQWQVSKDNGGSWSNVNSTKFPSALKATLTFTSASSLNGYLYRCVIKNSAGSVTSNSAKLTVTGGLPVITGQPANKTVALSSSVTFKVTASGTNLSYQWQYSRNNGTSWVNWDGKISASVTVVASTKNNGCLYRCIVSNSAGSVVTSNAKLTVTGAYPGIITQPSNVTAAEGKTVTFKVEAMGATGYQWQYSKDGGSTWVDCKSGGYNKASFSFTASAAYSGRRYRCIVSNSYGSVISGTAVFTAK